VADDDVVVRGRFPDPEPADPPPAPPQAPLCGARRPGKPHCPLPAGARTDHLGYGRCARHGGATRGGRHHAALLLARELVARRKAEGTFYGQRVSIEPEAALLEEVARSTAAVRWIESQLQEWGRRQRADAEVICADPAATPHDREVALEVLGRPTSGTVTVQSGETMHGAADLEAYLTGMPQLVAVHSTERAVGFTDTELAAWLKVYREERKLLAKVSKACIDAGIAERMAAMLEQRAVMHAHVLRHALVMLGAAPPDPEQMRLVLHAATTKALAELPPGRTTA
jgi:hypothetical protein